MRPHIADLSKAASTHIIAFPNAGLPNAFGEYDETPEDMTGQIAEWIDSQFVNILGGCCGTTPAHIDAIAKRATGAKARKLPEIKPTLRLSGLEPFSITV